MTSSPPNYDALAEFDRAFPGVRRASQEISHTMDQEQHDNMMIIKNINGCLSPEPCRPRKNRALLDLPKPILFLGTVLLSIIARVGISSLKTYSLSNRVAALTREHELFDHVKDDLVSDELLLNLDRRQIYELEERIKAMQANIKNFKASAVNEENHLLRSNEKMKKSLDESKKYYEQRRNEDFDILRRLSNESKRTHKLLDDKHAENIHLKEMLAEINQEYDREVEMNEHLRGSKR